MPSENLFLIDMHIHTRRYSSCSQILPEELPSFAMSKHLSAIVITEHECIWPEDELETLRQSEPDLLILNGAECTTQQGDFLVIGVESFQGLFEIKDATRLIREVCTRGGVTIWAHPFRFGEPAFEYASFLKPDAVEVASSNMTGEVCGKAEILAEKNELFPVSCSDAHVLKNVGSYRMQLPRAISNEFDLAACLREMGGK